MAKTLVGSQGANQHYRQSPTSQFWQETRQPPNCQSNLRFARSRPLSGKGNKQSADVFHEQACGKPADVKTVHAQTTHLVLENNFQESALTQAGLM